MVVLVLMVAVRIVGAVVVVVVLGAVRVVALRVEDEGELR